MLKPEYIVELLICEYMEGRGYKATGKVLASFPTKTEAEEFGKKLIILANECLKK